MYDICNIYVLYFCTSSYDFFIVAAVQASNAVVARKAVVEAFVGSSNAVFEETNVLLKTHCLCMSPPVSAFLDDIANYQLALQEALQFMESLDGKFFDGKKLKISVITEPSMTEDEADLWSQLWGKITENKKKRY